MPAKVKDDLEKTKIKESEAMTVILAPDDKVFYYFGLNSPNDPSVAVPKIEVTDFSANGIRKVLLIRKQQVPKLTILIKTYEDGDLHAKYKDLVDILDEMNITDQKRYALVDMGAQQGLRCLSPAAHLRSSRYAGAHHRSFLPWLASGGLDEAPDLSGLSGEGKAAAPVAEVVEDKVYTYVEQMPQLPGGGGQQAIVNAIQKAFRYPAVDLRNQIE
nr:hypothetical protein [Tanacetum cinerariifolium]